MNNLKTINKLAMRGLESSKTSVKDLELQRIVMLSQPIQLDDNQKVVLEWLKENECETNDPLESISDLFLNSTPSKYFPDSPLSCLEAAYQSLNNQQKMELVSEYLKQYSEQEE